MTKIGKGKWARVGVWLLALLALPFSLLVWMLRPSASDPWRFLDDVRPIEEDVLPPGAVESREYRAYCLPRSFKAVSSEASHELKPLGYRLVANGPTEWRWKTSDDREV